MRVSPRSINGGHPPSYLYVHSLIVLDMRGILGKIQVSHWLEMEPEKVLVGWG